RRQDRLESQEVLGAVIHEQDVNRFFERHDCWISFTSWPSLAFRNGVFSAVACLYPDVQFLTLSRRILAPGFRRATEIGGETDANEATDIPGRPRRAGGPGGGR